MQLHLAHYWLNAAKSGFANALEWKKWADNLIERTPKPPYWLIELSLAKGVTDLETLIANFPVSEVTHTHNDAKALGDPAYVLQQYDVIFGYLWWRFEKNELSLGDCLQMCGEMADGGLSSFECETFFTLLNRLEAGETKKEIERSATGILSHLQKMAEKQWNEIISCLPNPD